MIRSVQIKFWKTYLAMVLVLNTVICLSSNAFCATGTVSITSPANGSVQASNFTVTANYKLNLASPITTTNTCTPKTGYNTIWKHSVIEIITRQVEYSGTYVGPFLYYNYVGDLLYYLDDNYIGSNILFKPSPDDGYPTMNIDTQSLANGPHVLTVKLRDDAFLECFFKYTADSSLSCYCSN